MSVAEILGTQLYLVLANIPVVLLCVVDCVMWCMANTAVDSLDLQKRRAKDSDRTATESSQCVAQD